MWDFCQSSAMKNSWYILLVYFISYYFQKFMKVGRHSFYMLTSEQNKFQNYKKIRTK